MNVFCLQYHIVLQREEGLNKYKLNLDYQIDNSSFNIRLRFKMDRVSAIFRGLHRYKKFDNEIIKDLNNNLSQVFTKSSRASIESVSLAMVEREIARKGKSFVRDIENEKRNHDDKHKYYESFENYIKNGFQEEERKIMKRCEKLVVDNFSSFYKNIVRSNLIAISLNKKLLKLSEENELDDNSEYLRFSIASYHIGINLARYDLGPLQKAKTSLSERIKDYVSIEGKHPFLKVKASKTKKIPSLDEFQDEYVFYLYKDYSISSIPQILTTLKCLLYKIEYIKIDEKINSFQEKKIEELTHETTNYENAMMTTCKYLGPRIREIKIREVENNKILNNMLISLIRNGYDFTLEEAVSKIMNYSISLTTLDCNNITDIFQAKKKYKIPETSMLLDEYVFFNVESQKVNLEKLEILFECLGFDVIYEKDKNKKRYL